MYILLVLNIKPFSYFGIKNKYCKYMYRFQGLSYHDCWGNKADEYICTKMQMPVIKCMQND